MAHHWAACVARKRREEEPSQRGPENHSRYPTLRGSHRCGLLRVRRRCQLPQALPEPTRSYCSSHPRLCTSASSCWPTSLPRMITDDHPGLEALLCSHLPTALSTNARTPTQYLSTELSTLSPSSSGSQQHRVAASPLLSVCTALLFVYLRDTDVGQWFPVLTMRRPQSF